MDNDQIKAAAGRLADACAKQGKMKGVELDLFHDAVALGINTLCNLNDIAWAMREAEDRARNAT